ncbi:MAG TPA: BlaI/MecI/CopY family transcriptional regulator [Tepidisphaeraceae bacterium]|nr:BlaI/MecI/CopY family transcriptional regulator [Tepidisphaeraceae bacterium]
MPKPPAISDAEWDVMQVLWETSRLTANEVVERVLARRNWNPRTVKTLLNRLMRKGVLGFEPEGKRYRYFPKVSREECVRNESRSFLDRVFGGALGPMLAHFVNETPLTPDEMSLLRELIDQRQRKGK